MEAVGRYAATERVDPSWTKGGSDYAGCVGSGIAFNDTARQTYHLNPSQLNATVNTTTLVSPFTQHASNVGIFGVNSHTRFGDISDGTSNVIMVSERELFTLTTPSQHQSSDGWAFGGPATLFSTRNPPQPIKPINNTVNSTYPSAAQHYDEAATSHGTAVQALMGDGSARSFSVNMDLKTWRNLGNIAQGAPVNVGD